MIYTPFPFQFKCIEKGLEVLLDSKGRREVLVAPVGAGKAIMIAEIASRLPKDGNILVVQPNKELLIQNLDKIESLGIFPAVNSASLKRREIGRIIYAMPGSLTVDFLRKANIKWVLIDEADHGTKPGSTFTDKLKKLNLKSVLGLTASPIYLQSTLNDGSVLKMMTRVKGAFFRDICHVTSIKEVREYGRWSELRYVEHEFDNTGLVLNSTGSDYTDDSVKLNYVEADTESKIIGLLKHIPENESVLIFVPGIDNVEALTKKIKGAKCVHANTKDSDRDEAISSFKSGTLRVLINSSILNTGFDYPNLRNIIDGYPTNSARIHYQKYGRLVRIDDRKPYGTVHDLVGNVEKFGKIEDFNFDNIPGYGWGMFKGDYLITGVPMKERLNVTKKDLVMNKATKSKDTKYDFEFDKSKLTEGVMITFGKHKGKTFKQVFSEDKGYLVWLNTKRKSKEFDFDGKEDLEKELIKTFL